MKEGTDLGQISMPVNMNANSGSVKTQFFIILGGKNVKKKKKKSIYWIHINQIH